MAAKTRRTGRRPASPPDEPAGRSSTGATCCWGCRPSPRWASSATPGASSAATSRSRRRRPAPRRPPPQGPRRGQRGPARRGSPGAGAGRRHAPDPRPALPGRVRHLEGVQPEAGRQHAQEVQVRGQRVRRLPGDARQGEGPRRGRHRDPRLLARAAHRRLPEGRQARLLREGDVEHPGGRPEHGARRPRDREAPPDRAPAAQPPALPALLREAARGGEAPRAGS